MKRVAKVVGKNVKRYDTETMPGRELGVWGGRRQLRIQMLSTQGKLAKKDLKEQYRNASAFRENNLYDYLKYDYIRIV